jgi:hypothetical protein
MIPKVADIINEFAVVIDQGMVNRDHALRRVARLHILLQPGEPLPVECLGIPDDFGQPAIEAGLIGGLSELRMGCSRRSSWPPPTSRSGTRQSNLVLVRLQKSLQIPGLPAAQSSETQ